MDLCGNLNALSVQGCKSFFKECQGQHYLIVFPELMNEIYAICLRLVGERKQGKLCFLCYVIFTFFFFLCPSSLSCPYLFLSRYWHTKQFPCFSDLYPFSLLYFNFQCTSISQLPNRIHNTYTYMHTFFMGLHINFFFVVTFSIDFFWLRK